MSDEFHVELFGQKLKYPSKGAEAMSVFFVCTALVSCVWIISHYGGEGVSTAVTGFQNNQEKTRKANEAILQRLTEIEKELLDLKQNTENLSAEQIKSEKEALQKSTEDLAEILVEEYTSIPTPQNPKAIPLSGEDFRSEVDSLKEESEEILNSHEPEPVPPDPDDNSTISD